MRRHVATLLGSAGLRNRRSNWPRIHLDWIHPGTYGGLCGREARAETRRNPVVEHRRRLHQREPRMESTRQEKSKPRNERPPRQSSGSQRQGSARNPVETRIRVARQRVVPPQRHCLAQAECDAGKRERSAHSRTRVSLHAHEGRTVRLRPRSCERTCRGREQTESANRLERQHVEFRKFSYRGFPRSVGRAVHSRFDQARRFRPRSLFRFRNCRPRRAETWPALRRY